MTCIIVDDEPLAREGIQLLIDKEPLISLLGSFNSADAAAKFLANNSVDLIFLDIQMPGTSGLDFAKSVPANTLIVFTTAFAEYALNSYEVEAIDYLVKPIKADRFHTAVAKTEKYLQLLKTPLSQSKIEQIADDYFFVKADRRVFKILFNDILFVEGLKDYVVIHTLDQKIITAMNIKTIFDQLPKSAFARVSKSYIVNIKHVTSFDNNSIFIQKNEIPIGNAYRTNFFNEFVSKKLIGR